MQHKELVITYKGKVIFAKQLMPQFNRIPKQYVENEACFIFVNQGKMSVRSQDELLSLDPKHALLAKCLNYFFESNNEQKKTSSEVEAIAVILYPSLIKEIFEFDLSASNYEIDFNLKQIELDRLLLNFKESISILLDNPELVDENLIKTKLREFVLLISKSQNAPSELDFLAALFKPNEVEFKTIIQKNIFASLSIDELASLCHLSTSTFKRKFKEVFHQTPKKYILAKKVERAAELLKTQNLRISDIAYDVGFDSLATFNRNFHLAFGKSPSEYRLIESEESLN
jgi:AraC family transcriptional regulator, exoenzyme S synthesis regulatory protein ExsA